MEQDSPAERTAVFESPVGPLGVVVSPAGLRRVLLPSAARRVPWARYQEFTRTDGTAARAVEQITEYTRGARREFDLPLDLTGVAAEPRRVLEELCASAPFGKVITYGELAHRSGCSGGARGVGQIMARNPLPLVIPCHRVVAAGDLGGYGGGLALKRRLLRLEGALTEQLSLLG